MKIVKNYKEIIYNNSIFAVKQYLIVDIDRENDPKNEMIFIYPEILDLRNQSKCINSQYIIELVINTPAKFQRTNHIQEKNLHKLLKNT